ncbi:MAG: BamA/TamA family outer membrane protein [Salinibacter sp.]
MVVFPVRPWFRIGLLAIALALASGALPSASGWAQAPLYLVNSETTVDDVSFRFSGTQTFEADRLQQQIATTAPGTLARLRNAVAFVPGLQRRAFPFDPITLQKDVVRLRNFYRRNGFPNPRIDYPATQLDTTDNQIHVIFTIQEGTPVTIREQAFRTADEQAPLASHLPSSLQSDWASFRQSTTAQADARYTEFKRSETEGDVRTWFRNQGYAFAEVTSDVDIDSTANTATLRYLVDPGPLGRVSEIVVDGNESVSANIVRRELPFEVGDRFSSAQVSEGQRRLFDLNLFRVALADVPDQPRDSTVTVRYRVRESNLRAYSGQFGYGTQPGLTMEGSWRHRNFRGNGRNLIVGLTADTGYPQNPPSFLPNFLAQSASRDPDRRFRASVTLRQPYLFAGDLSGTLEPFVQERINSSIGASSDRFLGLNERQFGLNTTLIYDLLPFRSLSLRHSFARIQQFRGGGTVASPGADSDDLFDKSVFSLSGTLGKTDDFINPTRGYIIRPSIEAGGIPFESGVDFVRTSAEVSGYLPLADQVELAGRVFGGIVWPVDASRDNLTIPPTASAPELRRNRVFQDRFSEYLFYGGGGSDVRGWPSQLGGGKVLQRSSLARADFVYRPVGARSKLGVNLEARLPFPGLGADWRSAVFLDAAYLSPGDLNLVPPPSVTTPPGPEGTPVATDPTDVMVGSGLGLRYQTPFGFVRFDAAYKLTPDALDLRRPGAVGNAVTIENQSLDSVPTRTIRRFRLHFGIGRTF